MRGAWSATTGCSFQGEPLLRPHLPDLVGDLRASHPDLEINLITKSVLLPAVVADLRAAGLTRVTISVDGLRQ